MHWVRSFNACPRVIGVGGGGFVNRRCVLISGSSGLVATHRERTHFVHRPSASVARRAQLSERPLPKQDAARNFRRLAGGRERGLARGRNCCGAALYSATKMCPSPARPVAPSVAVNAFVHVRITRANSI